MAEIDTFTPECAALVDLEEIAAQLKLPPALARMRLEVAGEYPIATYRGKSLWLADTVHDALPGTAGVPA